MPHPLIDELMKRAPVIVDGAWGTQLQQRGLPVGGCAEAWNLEHPERVEEVARAYVEAGSQIILTNSFCGNRQMLERHGLAARAAEINRAAAEISRRAAGDTVHVFGSMGPTGTMLMMGDISEEELSEIFTEQALALQAGGADGIVIETMSALDEAACAVRAARSTGLPVVACMVYDSGADYDHTMMGVTPEQAVPALVEAGADVIGANCGVGILEALPVGARLVAATDLPVWMKPNAGMPVMVDGKAQYSMKPDEFGDAALRAIASGARFIGGCCGTRPDFIRAIATRR
jgi:methionine synthase I (cobalamin-dependent)